MQRIQDRFIGLVKMCQAGSICKWKLTRLLMCAVFGNYLRYRVGARWI